MPPQKHWIWNYYSAKGACNACNQSYSNGSVERRIKHLQDCKKISEHDRRVILLRLGSFKPTEKPSNDLQPKPRPAPSAAPTLDNFVDSVTKDTKAIADKHLLQVKV